MNPTTKNQTLKCESRSSQSSFSPWGPSLRLDQSTRDNVRKSWLSKVLQTLVAFLDAADGHFATLSKSAAVNSRLFFGGAVLILSPFTTCICHLFDPSVGFPLSAELIAALKSGRPPEDYWYYINWHFFFATIDEPLFILVAFTGVFLLFPARHIPSFGLIIPIGYGIGKLAWLWTCNSDVEVNQFPPLSFWLIGFATAGVVMLSYRYWVDRHEHKFRRIEAAIMSLVDHPNIDAETKKKCLKVELNNMRNFQSIF